MKKKIKTFVVDKKKGQKVAILIPPSKNSATLASFALFCKENPQLRFWQALSSWSERRVYLADTSLFDVTHDPFYWEGRNEE